MRAGSFLAELKRRNVWRAAALYVGAVWALAQGIASLGPSFGMPEWGTRWFVIAGVIGFPFWLAFAWFYEWTPEGFKREREVAPDESITPHTGRKLDFAIIGVLAVAVVLLLTDRFVLRRGVNQQPVVAVSEKSIAVLPFVDMSQGKDQEYFSDGISEELLNLLAKVETLHVAARTSSFSFKGKDMPIPEIAKALHVAHVLEGSVRKAGDQVRITTQLIRAADGYHLWSQTYDRKLDDIFAIQDEISAKVVEELKVKLLGAAPKARTTDPEAYALYLRAAQLRLQNNVEAYQQSEELLRKVLAIDPRYVPAWHTLARIFYSRANEGLVPAQEGYDRAREAARKALEIDPDFAASHALLGASAAFGDHDMREGARHMQRALALDPTDLDVLFSCATLLQSLDRLDQALELSEAIVRRDPVNVGSILGLGYFQRLAGRLDAAIASFHTALSLNPARGATRFQLGTALLLKGDAQGALAEFEQEPIETYRMISLPLAYHALGRKADSDAALAATIAKYERDAPFNIAIVYAFRGEPDKAFEWLDKAVEYRDPGNSEAPTENLLDSLHSDPRWAVYLRKVGYAPEDLAKIEFKVALPEAWRAEAATQEAAAAERRP